MKNLIILAALTFSLFLAACSNTDEGITSPVSPELDKSNGSVQSFPYELYQTFPELKSAVVKWKNDRYGITIAVNDRSTDATNKNLFAVIDYVDNRGAAMVFLGESRIANYYLKGFNEKEIRSISVYYTDLSTSAVNYLQPYSNSQIFKNIGVKGWSDGGANIKVSAHSSASVIRQLFAQLITSEGNQIIFLGNPNSATFEFPKPGKFTLRDIRLFSYR